MRGLNVSHTISSELTRSFGEFISGSKKVYRFWISHCSWESQPRITGRCFTDTYRLKDWWTVQIRNLISVLYSASIWDYSEIIIFCSLNNQTGFVFEIKIWFFHRTSLIQALYTLQLDFQVQTNQSDHTKISRGIEAFNPEEMETVWMGVNFKSSKFRIKTPDIDVWLCFDLWLVWLMSQVETLNNAA